MKVLVAFTFAAATALAAPLPAFAAFSVAQVCSDSAPAGWQRPGGYCDQIGGGGSLSEPSSLDTPDVDCTVSSLDGWGDRLLVAEPVPTGPCGTSPCVGGLFVDPGALAGKEAILVAVGCPV